jgi:hypothetical protein
LAPVPATQLWALAARRTHDILLPPQGSYLFDTVIIVCEHRERWDTRLAASDLAVLMLPVGSIYNLRCPTDSPPGTTTRMPAAEGFMMIDQLARPDLLVGPK